MDASPEHPANARGKRGVARSPLGIDAHDVSSPATRRPIKQSKPDESAAVRELRDDAVDWVELHRQPVKPFVVVLYALVYLTVVITDGSSTTVVDHVRALAAETSATGRRKLAVSEQLVALLRSPTMLYGKASATFWRKPVGVASCLALVRCLRDPDFILICAPVVGSWRAEHVTFKHTAVAKMLAEQWTGTRHVDGKKYRLCQVLAPAWARLVDPSDGHTWARAVMLLRWRDEVASAESESRVVRGMATEQARQARARLAASPRTPASGSGGELRRELVDATALFADGAVRTLNFQQLEADELRAENTRLIEQLDAARSELLDLRSGIGAALDAMSGGVLLSQVRELATRFADDDPACFLPASCDALELNAHDARAYARVRLLPYVPAAIAALANETGPMRDLCARLTGADRSSVAHNVHLPRRRRVAQALELLCGVARLHDTKDPDNVLFAYALTFSLFDSTSHSTIDALQRHTHLTVSSGAARGLLDFLVRVMPHVHRHHVRRWLCGLGAAVDNYNQLRHFSRASLNNHNNMRLGSAAVSAAFSVIFELRLPWLSSTGFRTTPMDQIRRADFEIDDNGRSLQPIFELLAELSFASEGTTAGPARAHDGGGGGGALPEPRLSRTRVRAAVALRRFFVARGLARFRETSQSRRPEPGDANQTTDAGGRLLPERDRRVTPMLVRAIEALDTVKVFDVSQLLSSLLSELGVSATGAHQRMIVYGDFILWRNMFSAMTLTLDNAARLRAESAASKGRTTAQVGAACLAPSADLPAGADDATDRARAGASAAAPAAAAIDVPAVVSATAFPRVEDVKTTGALSQWIQAIPSADSQRLRAFRHLAILWVGGEFDTSVIDGKRMQTLRTFQVPIGARGDTTRTLSKSIRTMAQYQLLHLCSAMLVEAFPQENAAERAAAAAGGPSTAAGGAVDAAAIGAQSASSARRRTRELAGAIEMTQAERADGGARTGQVRRFPDALLALLHDSQRRLYEAHHSRLCQWHTEADVQGHQLLWTQLIREAQRARERERVRMLNEVLRLDAALSSLQ